MRDWIMPVGFDHADAEAKHLVASADDDKVSSWSLIFNLWSLISRTDNRHLLLSTLVKNY